MNKLNFEPMKASKKVFLNEVKTERAANKKDRKLARQQARNAKIFLNSL